MSSKDAHEGPLVDETSERHLGYQIRGNYQASCDRHIVPL